MAGTSLRKRARLFAASGVLGLAAMVLGAAPGFAQVSDSYNNNNLSHQGGTQNSNLNGNGNTQQQNNNNQNMRQGQSQGNNNGTNSITQNDYYPSTQTIKNVPNIYAPGLTAAGSEVCLGSVSAGGGAAGFGLTLGGTTVDQECQLRLNAKTLATLGYAAAAREEMCLDPQVRQAMWAAGTPCAADRATYEADVRAASEHADARVRDTYKPVALAAPQHLALDFSANAAPAPASDDPPDVPAAPPGCHKAYQLIGGWYNVCPNGGDQ